MEVRHLAVSFFVCREFIHERIIMHNQSSGVAFTLGIIVSLVAFTIYAAVSSSIQLNHDSKGNVTKICNAARDGDTDQYVCDEAQRITSNEYSCEGEKTSTCYTKYTGGSDDSNLD